MTEAFEKIMAGLKDARAYLNAVAQDSKYIRSRCPIQMSSRSEARQGCRNRLSLGASGSRWVHSRTGSRAVAGRMGRPACCLR